MFWKKRKRLADEELDQIGRSVLWAAASSDDEAGRVASSPHLYARLRARIDEEQRRRAEPADGWLAVFAEARRAAVVLALIAIVAAGALWLARATATTEARPVTDNSPNIRPVAVGACSLASADECAISNEDVLATLFAEGEGGTQK